MGFTEILFIALVVLLFFGAGKLPGVGAGLGKVARGFRDALKPDRTPPPEPPPASTPPRALPPQGPKP